MLGSSFLPKKILSSPVILSRNSPGGLEKFSRGFMVMITWLEKGMRHTFCIGSEKQHIFHTQHS